MKKIVLKLWYSPGDTLAFTAALKSVVEYWKFSSEYRYVFDVKTPYPEIFYNNPNITEENNFDTEVIEIDYKYEYDVYKNSGVHVTRAFVNGICRKMFFQTNSSYLYPEIFLTKEEMDREYILSKYGITGNFWLFNAGIKNDIPLKAYPPLYWQAVVNKLKSFGIQLIQVGSNKHIHPNSFNVQSLVGKTENIRDYMVLCYHAEGHICHVSFPMHIMAAYRKPCVILAGGRENPRWEIYPNHVFLHSVGMLNCCLEDGCWYKVRSECVKMDSVTGGTDYPKCMSLIDPDDVVNSVLNYNGRYA